MIGALSGVNRREVLSKSTVRSGAPSRDTRQFRGFSQKSSVDPSSVRESSVIRYLSMSLRSEREHVTDSSVLSLIWQLNVLLPALLKLVRKTYGQVRFYKINPKLTLLELMLDCALENRHQLRLSLYYLGQGGSLRTWQVFLSLCPVLHKGVGYRVKTSFWLFL